MLHECVGLSGSRIVIRLKVPTGGVRVKYVLMFIETEEYAKELEAMTPGEREQAYQKVYQWFDDHRDKIRGGSKLQGAETATTVRFDGGVPMTTDGPFIEGKEVVSGFTELEVADLDEALRIVKTWPACPVVEIRPVAEM
jgi:hypothetical protein